MRTHRGSRQITPFVFRLRYWTRWIWWSSFGETCRVACIPSPHIGSGYDHVLVRQSWFGRDMQLRRNPGILLLRVRDHKGRIFGRYQREEERVCDRGFSQRASTAAPICFPFEASEGKRYGLLSSDI